ncbi:MAG: DUF4433 domain-containing protein [Myxococcota bacterium]
MPVGAPPSSRPVRASALDRRRCGDCDAGADGRSDEGQGAHLLYNIKTGWNGIPQLPMSDIATVVSSVPTVEAQELRFVLTDRHAYLGAAQLASDSTGLERVDWKILRARDFQRSLADPEKVERYQAEALVHRHVPLEAIVELVCWSPTQKAQLQNELTWRGLSLKLTARPEWYF